MVVLVDVSVIAAVAGMNGSAFFSVVDFGGFESPMSSPPPPPPPPPTAAAARGVAGVRVAEVAAVAVEAVGGDSVFITDSGVGDECGGEEG